MSIDGIEWAEEAEGLNRAAQSDQEFYEQMASELLRPQNKVAVDFGCGGAGMAVALREQVTALGSSTRVIGIDAHEEVFAAARDAHPDIKFAVASFEDSADRLAEVTGGGVDLLWARGAIHHAADEQLAVDTLAKLLAPDGVLALAEGGTTVANMPYHVGVGEPGMHSRLRAALSANARQKMADLKPMAYGWLTGMRRAGLEDARTRNVLFDKPEPLEGADMDHVLSTFAKQVEWAGDFLSEEDKAAWQRLLDPQDSAWLGTRDDMFYLATQSVHLARRPAKN